MSVRAAVLTIVVSAILAIPVVQPEGTAWASDSKFFSGTECIASNGANQDVVNYLRGRAENTSASDIVIKCPVLRDNTVDNPEVLDFEAWVWIQGSQTFTCTVYAVDSDNDTQDWNTQQANTNGHTVLDFGAEPDTTADGSIYLACTVPAVWGGNRMGIDGYLLKESGS